MPELAKRLFCICCPSKGGLSLYFSSRCGFVLSGCDRSCTVNDQHGHIVSIQTSSERLEVTHFPLTPSQSVNKWCACPNCPSMPNGSLASSNPCYTSPTSFCVFPHQTQFPSCLCDTPNVYFQHIDQTHRVCFCKSNKLNLILFPGLNICDQRVISSSC